MSFVELAAVNDPQLAATTIAAALGLRAAGSKPPEDLLIEFLSNKKALLILDNFEQITPAAILVSELLENCRELKLLVTSRVTLRLRGEQELPVLPLGMPEKNRNWTLDDLVRIPSVALFIQRARAINPQFTMDDSSIAVIAEICRRLEGLPLAIELAAARTRLLSPKALLDRLDKRLPLLTRGTRDMPHRQQTMRKTIAWSYDLLEPEEALLFRRLAVFVGGCTFDATNAVANFDHIFQPDLFEAFESLVQKNLLQSRPVTDPRFEMLETIREFALEKLKESGEQSESERIHAEYYVELAQTTEPFYRRAQRAQWLEKIESELDNIRAIFSRSRRGQIPPEHGIRLAGTLGWFCHLRGHLSEGRNWAESMLSLPAASERTLLRARLLFPAGGLAWSQSDYENSIRYLEESVSIFREMDDKFWQIQAQVLLAGAVASIGDYKKAYDLADETVTLARKTDDRWGEAYSLYWLGDILLLHHEDLKRARELYQKSLAIYSDLKDPWGEAEVRGHIGIVANVLQDYENAKSSFEISLQYMETIGDKWAIARSLSGLGDTFFHLKDLDQAKSAYKRSISHWNDLGNIRGIQLCLSRLAHIAFEEDRYDEAVTFYGAAPDPVRIVGILLVHTDNSEYQSQFDSLRQSMGEQRWQQAYQYGKSMSPDSAMEFAAKY